MRRHAMNADQDAPGSDTGYQDFLLSLLSRRERFFTEVVQGEHLGRKLKYSILTLLVLSALYGAIVGSYASFPQAVSAGIKLPLLFLLTFIVCFPAFFVVQILVGSRLRLMQVLVLVMATLALTSIILAALTPIAAFFLITGSNYYFLVLLHIVLVLVAGMFGMYALHEGLALVCEQHTVYPRKAMTIMRVWAFIFAFVGIQMAWNFRPFLGDRDQPFKVFRSYEGNFYAAIVYSLERLFEDETGSEQKTSPAVFRREDR
jgi:hypothetical protein